MKEETTTITMVVDAVGSVEAAVDAGDVGEGEGAAEDAEVSVVVAPREEHQSMHKRNASASPE